MKKLFLIGIILSVALLGCSNEQVNNSSSTDATSGKSSADKSQQGSMLEKVKNRGELIAGINGSLPGFSYMTEDGSYKGLDVDLAKAVAAAVFGNPEAIEFRPLSNQERFTAVQTGEVDILTRNTTWTFSRDVVVGLNYGPTTFYDGQGIMVRKDSGIKSLEDLEGARIAIQAGTTSELTTATVLGKLGVNYKSVVFENIDASVAAYQQGSADAWTTDKSGLVARRAAMADPSEHIILPETLAKEPLTPAVADGDQGWFDILQWTIYTLIMAEELGITQDNVDSFMDSEEQEIRSFLGLEGDLGKELGLGNDFTYNIIKAVGNYGEIYNRNLGPDTVFNLDRGLNKTWKDGGLLYSPPFR